MRLQRLILITTLMVSQAATAALGDRESAISSDLVKMKAASVRRTSVSGVTVHEIESPIRTIKEYVNADGVVFAVRWMGVRPPDFSAILGSYFEEYKAENENRGRAMTRQSVEIKSANIRVRKGGHMRAISGSAYIEALVPAGFNVGDLK